jgi:hypothetical protein
MVTYGNIWVWEGEETLEDIDSTEKMVHFTVKRIFLWWLSEVRLYHVLSQMNPVFPHLLFFQCKFCIVRPTKPKFQEFSFLIFLFHALPT